MNVREQLKRVAYQESIRQRLADYNEADAAEQRDQLVAEWRRCHPDAAAEAPSYTKPLIRVAGYRKSQPEEPDETWHNDTYTVTVRRHKKDPVFGTSKGMIQIGISSLDGSARHDWRDFQAIKNQIAGPEVEGFELYPQESRLLDPSNYYSLWCFPGAKRIHVGIEERLVYDADEALAPQRAFAQREQG